MINWLNSTFRQFFIVDILSRSRSWSCLKRRHSFQAGFMEVQSRGAHSIWPSCKLCFSLVCVACFRSSVVESSPCTSRGTTSSTGYRFLAPVLSWRPGTTQEQTSKRIYGTHCVSVASQASDSSSCWISFFYIFPGYFSRLFKSFWFIEKKNGGIL